MRTTSLVLVSLMGVAAKDTRFPAESSCEAHEAVATIAAGCFWSVELAFQRVPGVLSTQVGYTGGHVERPRYEDVYAGITGHAEAVRLVYDPSVITFPQILHIFEKDLPTSAGHETVGSHLTFDQMVAKHNPKDDHGSQYRSVVFTHDGTQQQEAEAWKARLEARHGKPIVTTVEPVSTFWPAEEYHQQYLEKGGQDADKGSSEPIKCYG